MCAFVAMLVLALVLIGSGESSGPPDLSHAILLQLNKQNPTKTKPIRSTLLLRLTVTSSGHTESKSFAPAKGVLSHLTELKGINNGTEQGGAIYWADCLEEENSSNITGHCEARLFITRPRAGSIWMVAVSAIDSGDQFSDSFSTDIQLSARLKDGAVVPPCPTYKMTGADLKSSAPVKFQITVPATGLPSLISCAP
jgi:hypothetical protein